MAHDMTNDISDLSTSFGAALTGLAAMKLALGRDRGPNGWSHKELVQSHIDLANAVVEINDSVLEAFGKVVATFERFDATINELADRVPDKGRRGRKG